MFQLSILLSIVLSFFLSAEGKPDVKEKEQKVAPNIILMIGDGMGLTQLSTPLYYGTEEPEFTKFPIVGLSRTSSSSHKITDSAAGATAFSTGTKTFNGAIGVGPDSTAIETILEYLHKQGYATGLVATSSITHATPASFYAHVDSRKKEFEIAEQLLNSNVDYFAGGGKQFFFDRIDEQNFYNAFAENGILIDTNSLSGEVLDPSKRYGFLLAKNGMPSMKDGRGNFLTEATSKGLEYFSNKKTPFFMMVEGSQIDWGGHANDGEYIYTETLDFDKAIGKALDFAKKDGNTIVIVTADHECGGFALVGKEVEVPFRGKQRDYDSLSFSFGSGGHSGTMVPVLAYGPMQESFSGIYQNTQIYHKLMAIVAP